MADYMHTGRASDAIRLHASKTLVSPADGTHNVVRLPKYAFVTRVWTNITTAFSAPGATLTVGFVGNGEAADTDAFMGTAATQPTLAALRASSEDNNPASQGKYFSAAGGMVTVTTDDNSGTAGTFTVFVEFYVIH